MGTAVHYLLERIAREGPELWPAARLAEEQAGLKEALISNGIPAGRVEPYLERIGLAVANTLESPRGRWILQAHAEAASELALSGVLDGQPVHKVLDRTFVDGEGVRWVIDFKTTEPEGEEKEAFLLRETERYRAQLEDYVRLLGCLEPQRTIRSALYFPLLDLWREI